MDFVVEDLAPTRKAILITADVAEVNAARLEAMGRIRRSVSLPGFRRGKVPDGVLERRFGETINTEVSDAFLHESLDAFLQERGIIPLSVPEYEGGVIARDKAFSCTVRLDVVPDFPLPDYVGLEVTQTRLVPDEDAVKAAIDRMRDAVAEISPVTQTRAPLDGEMAYIDYAGFADDVPIEGCKGENVALALGETQVPADFEAIVRTLVPGEEKEGLVSLPADYVPADLAGRTILMRIRLNSINRLEPPVPDDAFAKRFGFESMDKMRASVTDSVNTGRVRKARAVARQKLMDNLLARVDFPVPESLVASRTRHMLDDFRLRFRQAEAEGEQPSAERSAATEKVLEEKLEVIRPEIGKEAERLTRARLLLLRIAHAEDIRAGTDDADAYLRELSLHSGTDFEKTREIYLRTGMLDGLRERIQADKTLDFIYDKARITLVDPDPGSDPDTDAAPDIDAVSDTGVIPDTGAASAERAG
jgi:trigger factor